MKKHGFFLLIVLILFSCKNTPPAGEEIMEPERADETAGESVEPVVTPHSGGTVPAEIPFEEGDSEIAEVPMVDAPPEDAGAVPPAGMLTEPELELAETDAAALPPEKNPAPALPEPDAAALMVFREPGVEPSVETSPPAPVRPPTEVPVPPVPVIPPPPPILRPAEEAGPPPVRPAEEERPPSGIVREPVSPPVRSVPEPEISPLTPPPVVPEESLVFSRIVRATVGQLVEIPFRGTGWVYLGELGARRGISYDSRRLDPEGQSFVFRVEAAGTYALKFYKQDFIRDYIINDYVQVIAGEAPQTSAAGWFSPPLDRGRVSAERWPSALEEAEALERSRPGASGSSDPQADSPPAAVPALQGGSSVLSADAVPASAGSIPQGDSSAPAGSSSVTGSPVPPADSASVPASPGPRTGQSPEAQSTGAGVQPPARSGISDEGIVPIRPPAVAEQARASPETPPEFSAGAGGRTSPPAGSLPEDYLRKAREEFNAGRVAGAIAALDQFREQFPAGSDEAWWLYGQFYEANSPSRDIRTALDYYRRLVREYPQSRRYNDARRRIAYLERYYINIQ